MEEESPLAERIARLRKVAENRRAWTASYIAVSLTAMMETDLHVLARDEVGTILGIFVTAVSGGFAFSSGLESLEASGEANTLAAVEAQQADNRQDS